MSGYQPFETLRPILHRGPVAMPVVDVALVRGPVQAVVDKVVSPERASPVAMLGGKLRIKPEVVAEIVAMRECGESYRAICRALKVSNPTVQRYAGHVPPPKGGWRTGWDTGARQRIVRNKAFAERMRRAGFSYQEIGDNLGCCLSEAVRLLRGSRRKGRTTTPVSDMVQRVSEATGLPCSALRKGDFDTGAKVNRQTAKARHILFWLIRQRRPNQSYPSIGHALGGFDHSSVIHGVRRAEVVAVRIGLRRTMRPLAAARLLWAADWGEARPC